MGVILGSAKDTTLDPTMTEQPVSLNIVKTKWDRLGPNSDSQAVFWPTPNHPIPFY